MSQTTASGQRSTPDVFQAPLWAGLLDRTEAQILATEPAASRPGALSTEAAQAAVAQAHARLLVALAGKPRASEGVVLGLIDAAVGLIVGVAAMREKDAGRRGDHRKKLVDLLRRQLSAHERTVLAGEFTYHVRTQDSELPALRVRQVLSGLPHDRKLSDRDLLSLTTAVADLSSLLIRVAANAATGPANEAPEPRPRALDDTLRAIAVELAQRSTLADRPVDGRADVAAHHLAAALRVRVPLNALCELGASATNVSSEFALLDEARDAWLCLATHERTAVTALDSQLETPTYTEAFGSLSTAIVEGAANVLCGARLVGRPDAFRHSRAWEHQTTALTYALEAYIAAIRGDAPSLAQAQLIVLTRLVRAVVAIAILDLRRAEIPCPKAGS
jgi:hypothetical protein